MRSGVDPTVEPCALQVERIRTEFDDPPPVLVITGSRPARELDVLNATATCYLSLTRGEGWGIGIFEAAAAGNPVVTTGWGAPTEYLTSAWPFLVDHELVPVLNARDRSSYSPDQRWASADVEHAVALLRSVVDDPDGARRQVAHLTSDLRSRYSAAAIAPALIEVLGAAAG